MQAWDSRHRRSRRPPAAGRIAAAWKVLEAKPRGVKVPPLPAKRRAWSMSTRAWWKTIWTSPMAAEWLAADHGALTRHVELAVEHMPAEHPPRARREAEAILERDHRGEVDVPRRRLSSSGASVHRLRAVDASAPVEGRDE
jgi:hypothetical protein